MHTLIYVEIQQYTTSYTKNLRTYTLTYINVLGCSEYDDIPTVYHTYILNIRFRISSYIYVYSEYTCPYTSIYKSYINIFALWTELWVVNNCQVGQTGTEGEQG